MPKGSEEYRDHKKKAKWTLKEKRQRKRDKKMKDTVHNDIII